LTARPVAPWLTYSNWIVSLFFFGLGTRSLFNAAMYALNPHTPVSRRPEVILAMLAGSLLAMLTAVGIFEWKNWGRVIGVVFSVLNIILPFLEYRPHPSSLVQTFSMILIFILLLIWFSRPGVKAEFLAGT
jgi:hypothetical protein